VFGGKGNIVLELFGRMVIPTTRWALFLGFDLIAFSSLDAPQRPAGAPTSFTVSLQSVIGRETLEDGNFETTTQIL
jgi:hypothetical protein